MNRKTGLIVAGLLAVIALPVALKLSRGEPAKAVDVEQAMPQALAPSILASGALTYETQVTMAPEVTAQVKEVLIKEGDRVQRNQLLMRLDPTAPRAEIEQYQAITRQAKLTIETRQLEYDALQVKWRRYNELHDKGMIDASTLADLTSQRDLAEVALRTSRETLTQNMALLDAAREKLAKTEIRAPMDGQVTALYVKVGETAVQGFSSIAGSQLLQVADTSHLEAEVNVDETDIARIQIGAAAKVVPAAFPDQELTGKVDQVSVTPRQQTGQTNKTYPVRIRLNNSAADMFHPGMSCRAELLTVVGQQASQLAVPVQAVKYEEQTDDNKNADNSKSTTSVFVIDKDHVSKRTVSVGASDDNYIAITSGLQPGETIVTGPAKTLLFLKDGDRISINQPADDTSASSSTSAATTNHD